MSENTQVKKLPALVAEEVLRTIYGDDFKGCTVSPEIIAKIVRDAIEPVAASQHGLLDMYEKVVQAIHLLSTPPDITKVADRNALRSLLGERLDAIHAIATQTIETTGRLKS